LSVQGLQVGSQVVDALGIQKLADHIGWLQLSNGSRETCASISSGSGTSQIHLHRNQL
jgi:hypothetical protein